MLEMNERKAVIVVLLLASGLLGLDIYDDMAHGSSLMHVFEEAVIVLLCSIGILIMVHKYFVSKKENVLIKENLQKIQGDLNSYKKETQHLIEGLSLKIDEQFDKWQFSKSEKEIAFLLLKGLSNKEVASIRATSENTIKQQLNSIYQKSGLSGRAELSAFFLEDLFVFND